MRTLAADHGGWVKYYARISTCKACRTPYGACTAATHVKDAGMNSNHVWAPLHSSMKARLVTCACMYPLSHVRRYESVWEGDSFTIAFPTVLSAVTFATAVQQAMLRLDWPTALLKHAFAAEKRAVKLKTKSAPRRNASTLSLAASDGSFGQQNDSPTLLPGLPQLALSKFGSSGSFIAPVPLKSLQLSHQNSSVTDTSDGDTDKGPGSTYGTTLDSPVVRGSGGSQSTTPTGSSAQTPPSRRVRFGGEPKKERRASILSLVASGDSKTLMSRPSGLTEPDKQWSVIEVLQSQWQEVDAAAQDVEGRAVVVYRGLRVRIGMHAGVESESDISHNAASGRYVYTGKHV